MALSYEEGTRGSLASMFHTVVVHGLNHDELHITILVLYVVPVEYITYLVVSASDFIVEDSYLR